MKNLLNKCIISITTLSLCTTLYASDKVYKLKMATTWGPTLSPLIDAANNMADLAEKMSDGKLKIRVDTSNKHKSPLGILDMVKGGQYDMGHSASYYWKGNKYITFYFYAFWIN